MTDTLKPFSPDDEADDAEAPPFAAPDDCLLTLFDWSPDRIAALLDRAADLKAQAKAGECPRLLEGRTLVQVYDKPSLRTRLSFSAAMTQLGGADLFITSARRPGWRAARIRATWPACWGGWPTR